MANESRYTKERAVVTRYESASGGVQERAWKGTEGSKKKVVLACEVSEQEAMKHGGGAVFHARALTPRSKN